MRVLREMVMDLETSRLMLVLTSPRLPAPPELAQACATFDWPAADGCVPSLEKSEHAHVSPSERAASPSAHR